MMLILRLFDGLYHTYLKGQYGCINQIPIGKRTNMQASGASRQAKRMHFRMHKLHIFAQLPNNAKFQIKSKAVSIT